MDLGGFFWTGVPKFKFPICHKKMTLPLNPMELHHLIDSTNKLAQGDFSVRINPIQDNYPLNKLAENINKIALILENNRTTVNASVSCGEAKSAGTSPDCTHLEVEKQAHLFKASQDITHRKRLEEQLFQAQKMESVGRLAGGIAHDFNNMLSVILGYSELIRTQLPSDDPLVPDLMEIEKAATHSKETTRQLLAFSRKQIISPKYLDLNQVVQNTIATISHLIGEDIDIGFFPTVDVGKIEFDPSQLEQILINLAVNARDAMPTGGKLTIETMNITLDDAYCAGHIGSTPGNYVMLAISDNGMGMTKETRTHIFEPFFTTKEPGKGSGLGLSTVYGIVKQNNGYITVYSEPEMGTTFKIYIPKLMEKSSAFKKGDKVVYPKGSETVLLVEDDDLVRKMTAIMLKKLGYHVVVSESPLKAISLCRDSDNAIDLLLTDVVMPEMNGAALKEKIIAINPDIKVLFMSGYTSNIIAHHGVLEEGVEFIQKPFNLKDLAEKVHNVIQSAP